MMLLLLIALVQVIAPPTTPVIFCGQQAMPNAVSYQVVFDGGAPEPLTMDAKVDPQCPTGSTHSFRLPAARFTGGTHTVMVRAVNPHGYY